MQRARQPIILLITITVAHLVLPVAAQERSRNAAERLNSQVNLHVTGDAYEVLAAFARESGVSLLVDSGFGSGKTSVSASGSTRDVIKELSARLDCRYSIERAGIVTLVRRFSRAGEFPQANTLELRKAASDAIRALQLLSYRAGDDRVWGPMLIALGASLSSEQLAALKGGHKLESGVLSTSQKVMLQQAIITRVFGGVRANWELFTRQLSDLPRSTLRTEPFPPGSSEKLCRLWTAGPPEVWTAILGEIQRAPHSGNEPGEFGINRAPDYAMTPAKFTTAAGGAGISRLITIGPGSVTVASLIAGMSEQSGLKFYLPDSVGERRMFVALAGTPLRDVLDSLCSLYAWSWSSADGSGVSIERATRRLPQKPSEISAYLRSILPADIRTYLGITEPSEQPVFQLAGKDMGSRRDAILMSAVQTLSKSFTGPDSDVSALPFSKLPADCQEALLLILVAKVFDPNSDTELWRGGFGLHTMDDLDAKLGLDMGNILMVWRVRGDTTTGFGANIASVLK